MQSSHRRRSATDPMTYVNGEGLMSSPSTSSAESASVRISASPRWPALPVTRTLMLPSGPIARSWLPQPVRARKADGKAEMAAAKAMKVPALTGKTHTPEEVFEAAAHERQAQGDGEQALGRRHQGDRERDPTLSASRYP